MLSGVPTIIYGYFALLVVTPLLQKIYPELPGFNVLSAASSWGS
jgi:phosphate transport system permease protein